MREPTSNTAGPGRPTGPQLSRETTPPVRRETEGTAVLERADEPVPGPRRLPRYLPGARERVWALPEKYEPVRVIGTGGMGTVILARDVHLGRLVAIKTLHTDCPEFLGRLRAEARLLARLDHPSIVQVHDMDVFAGKVYLAMEYMTGGNLALARLDPEPLIRTVRGVVGALAHAHERGIVHRDVKPENVLLTRAVDSSGRAAQAVLSDFGLASGPADRSTSHLRPIVGTPLTMSPEQVGGLPVGPASDVFSFGVTLYRQLSGRWPFRGRGVVDVFEAIQTREPECVRDAARAESRTAVPRRLNAIICKALAKDPNARFASMHEMGRALDRFLVSHSLFHFPWARSGRKRTQANSIHSKDPS